MGCKKAQGFLESHAWQVSDHTDATKERKGEAEALALARSVDKIVIGRGKKVVTLDLKKDPPDNATLLSYLLGPSGNSKAPTIRKRKTLLVGFSEAAYQEVLGK